MKRRVLIALGECLIVPGSWLMGVGLRLTDWGDAISPRGAWLRRMHDDVPSSTDAWDEVPDAPMVYAKDGSPYKGDA